MKIYLITNLITNKKYVGQTHKSSEFKSPREAELAGFAGRSAIANVLCGISKSLRKYHVKHINSTPDNESVG